MSETPKPMPLIMVVDDDEDFRDSLAGFLETKNYRVHECQNGKDALAFCDEHTPDLILLDANMPDMDGFQVCSQLQKNPKNRSIPVIMITALADERSVDRAFEVGADEYITKPVNWSVLRLRIHRIIERKIRENALNESHEQYRLLLETSNFVPWEMDLANNKFTYMGPQIKNLLGYPVEDWTDFDYWVSRLHPDDREVAKRFSLTSTKKGEDHDFEYRVISAQGATVWLRDVVTLVRKNDEVTGLRGFFIDITEQKQGEHELHKTMDLLVKSENQLQAILSNTSAVVFLKNIDGRYILVNRRFEELFNISNLDVIDKSDFDLFPYAIAQKLYENDLAVLKHRKSLEIEEVIRHKEEHRTYISVKFPLFNENNKIFAIGGIATDITDRKLAEDDLCEAKQNAELANRAKSQFLAAMSHDIRTPMNAILGMGEVLAQSELNETQLHHLDILTHAGEGLLALINDILDLSKIEAGQLELEAVSFNLPDLISSSIHILEQRATSKNLKLDYNIDPKCNKIIVGDPQRLRQILLNLLGNAIKFTEQGKITLEVKSHFKDRILFVVRDTGIGISHKKLNSIFQPFTQADNSITRRFGGSGLGLSICNHLVEKMGGTIQVESEVGKGSSFSFTARLPKSVGNLADITLTQVIRQKSRNSSETKKATQESAMHILLVDDADDNILVIKAFLKTTPHTLQITKNGKQAVEAFAKGSFNMIMMDMMMPIMDGYEATRRIRALEKKTNRPAVPIVALTANAMKEDLEKTIEAGCDMYLSKPIRMKHLLDVIDSFVKNSSDVSSSLHYNEESTEQSKNSDNKNLKNSYNAINLDILNKLRKDLGGNIDSPLGKFLDQLPNRYTAIVEAINQKNSDSLKSSAHKLKGSSASFGAEQLVSICHQMELAGRAGQLPQDENLLDALKKECGVVQSELELFLSGENV
ncbi:MAG: response regulator [Magnetococcales bacterium]|nr:response regulator [Magnetococcales bacterium]